MEHVPDALSFDVTDSQGEPMDQISMAYSKTRPGNLPAPSPVAALPVPEKSLAERWVRLPVTALDRARLRRHRIVTPDRTDRAHVAFDVMRTKILKASRLNGWTVIGITSPTAACGTTTVTLNLAFSLARQSECRIAVLDLNLRDPGIASRLGISSTNSMANFMAGGASTETAFVRHGNNLAIGTSGSSTFCAAEILQGPGAVAALEKLKHSLAPDVILVDLPPMRANDDTMAFLPRIDCALLVAAAGVTTIEDIDACERELAAETNFLGVVLNRCRTTVDGHGY